MTTPVSLYLHFPFCRQRCTYCDFNTYAGKEDQIGPYLEALAAEVRWLAQKAPRRLTVHTIYFGGGTPSLAPLAGLEAVLQAIHEAFAVTPDAEVTLEANPGTLTLAYLQGLRRLGVNRLSLGVQASQPEALRLLGRLHDYFAVIQSVAWARRAGFTNLNLDLIYGLPQQTVEDWQRTLDLALGLRPEHLSLYALTLEHGTPLAAWVRRGLVAPPDDDLAATMYEWAAERLAQAGYRQYEISNWARPGFACRHNQQYWRNAPYLGLGAGAHGWIAGQRTVDVRAPEAYIRRMREARDRRPFPHTPATVEARRLSAAEAMEITMLMGLRLTEEGVSRAAFRQRFGVDLAEVYAEPIARLTAWGLLEWAGQGDDARLRLTPRAYLLGNVVFREFVGYLEEEDHALLS